LSRDYVRLNKEGACRKADVTGGSSKQPIVAIRACRSSDLPVDRRFGFPTPRARPYGLAFVRRILQIRSRETSSTSGTLTAPNFDLHLAKRASAALAYVFYRRRHYARHPRGGPRPRCYSPHKGQPCGGDVPSQSAPAGTLPCVQLPDLKVNSPSFTLARNFDCHSERSEKSPREQAEIPRFDRHDSSQLTSASSQRPRCAR
jgi:hypothetical protein